MAVFANPEGAVDRASHFNLPVYDIGIVVGVVAVMLGCDFGHILSPRLKQRHCLSPFKRQIERNSPDTA